MATATATYPQTATIPSSVSGSFASLPSASTPIRNNSPAPSRPIPTDFRSSLSAWWASNGYRDARIAEDRLLRRMSYYRPTPEAQMKGTGWFSVFASTPAPAVETPSATPAFTPSPAGLVATVRNVFIPTPDPALAPLHIDERPADLSSAASNSSHGSDKTKKNHRMSLHHKCDDGKMADYINTLEISRPDLENSKEAVVVLHGYAAALGFFFRNWDSIAHSAAETGRRAFFLDWLGMGASSRPNPSILASPVNTPVEARVSRAEHFFLSSLESWRASMGLEKMVLVGHSLGGYLASAYAIKYPERVSSLILVSPAGIPHGPDTAPAPLVGSSTTNNNKATGEQGHRASLDEAADAAEMEMSGPKGEGAEIAKRREASAVRRGMTKFFLWGWEKGLSPFSVLRGLGPWGPLLVGKYSSRRFASQDPEDVRDLHSYIYATSVLKGSGEFCISHILAPGAYARMPIVDRIHSLRMPVTFLYGDNDWMDVAGGFLSEHILEREGNKDVQVHVVPGAGHHLYLDNPEFTNKMFDQRIKSAPKVAA